MADKDDIHTIATDYTNKCALLGDLIYKADRLESQISDLLQQIQTIDKKAAALKAKEPIDDQ